MNKFFNELHRRNVIKATVAYLVASWLVLQVLSIVLPSFNAPDWIMKASLLVMVIGLPVWIIISWIYDLTPEGLKKTDELDEEETVVARTNQRLNFFILGALVGVVAVLLLRPAGKLIKTEDGKYAIAVLPFEDMGSNDENAWFGDGVTEDILTNLSQFGDLRVISRTSVNQYKNTDKTIPEIAEELGVSYVVEGSVRQTDDEMLITAQLIDATDKHLWSDNYRKTKDNVFDVQRDVSQQIVEQLKLTITPEQQKIINRPLTKNQDAMKLYLKARDMSDVSEGVSAIPIRQSIGLLKQAIELDPEFASAYAEIANSNFLLVTGGHLPLVEGEKETREWIKQALEIDPNNARAYSAIGFINAFKFCVIEATDIFWDNATENLEKSIQINPNDHRVLHHYAKLHNWGKNGKNRDEDIYLKQLELAIQIEPLSYLIITEYINALIVTNKYDKARELLLEKKFILGEYPGRNIHYSIVESWHQKDWKAGLEVWKKAVEDHPENANFWVNLGYKKISVQNDLSKAIKDFKKAYELDPKTGVDYANTLIENGDFKIVESLMKDQDFINAHDDNVVSKLMYYNIYMLEDYEKCIDEFDNLEPGEFENTIKAISYYKLGNKDKANEIKTKHINFDFNKITYFSEINQRDSLYHYLDKLEFFIAEIRIRHLYFTLRKHKNDPRFVAFLEKNYLPVISNK